MGGLVFPMPQKLTDCWGERLSNKLAQKCAPEFTGQLKCLIKLPPKIVARDQPFQIIARDTYVGDHRITVFLIAELQPGLEDQ